MTEEYSSGGFTIKWDSKKCIHSEVCIKSLPEVFNVKNKPWVNADGASTDKIKETVGNCPSGALSSFENTADTAESAAEAYSQSKEIFEDVEIKLLENGPLLVKGKVIIKDKDGNEIERKEKVSLCRCGGSKNKPYCDGSHKTNGFLS